MALPLLHLKGHSVVPGSVRANPGQPGQLIHVSGCQVVLLNEDDKQQQTFLRGHDNQITTFALSHSGQLAASAQAGDRSDVLLWDLTAGRIRTRFSEHDYAVLCLAFSLDDRLLLSVGDDRDQRMFILDTHTGNYVAKHVLEYKRGGVSKKATASAFAPSGGDIYTFAIAFGGDVVLWTLNPFTGLLSSRTVTAGSVRRTFTSLVFSPDGQWLYGGTTSGDVVTINVLRAAVQLVHPACSNGVRAMVLSSTGKLLVGGGDGSITLLSNDHMWRDMRPFVTVPGEITSLSPSADGGYLVVATADGGIYRVVSGMLSVTSIAQGPAGACLSLAAHSTLPTMYATACNNGQISCYSILDHSLLQAVAAEPTAGVPLSLDICAGSSHTPDVLISGWSDGNIRAHALQGPPAPGSLVSAAKPQTAPVWTIPGAHQFAHSNGVTALQAAHRGHMLATGGVGGEVRVWSMRSRQMLAHMKQHTGRINQVSILSDDAHLVTACEDRSLVAWDIGKQKSIATWRASTAVRAVAACPDQVTLLSAGTQERHVTVWDVRAPDAVHVIPTDSVISSLATSPTTSLFATGNTDCTVKLWDLRSTAPGAVGVAPLATGVAHTGAVGALLFHSSSCLLSGGADGCVGVWQP